jgi:DNA gyrase, A subunit
MQNIEVSIETEIQSSYIDYAMSVIVGRALPDARDGLKPAQRRILYAMYMIKNTHDQPTKKSARVVGEVLGKFHPHGDMAVYETLIRMAQDFSFNHPLVEGQGNMGSIDGDPPAAQRYTEVRTQKIAEEMLEDIEKRSVKFVQNFDNTEEEPVVLPSKIPNLLVNGSAGIAVGVATNILPHNLAEVCDAVCAYIDNKEIGPEGLMEYIKGPDFPTGGSAFMDAGLMRSYLTGRGSVTLRGIVEIEHEKGSVNLIIKEIPYNVNKAQLVERIAALVRDKVITGVGFLRDESSKDGIRVVIGMKKDANVELITNLIYTHTNLQVTNPVMNIAVIGNRLLTMNIKDSIKVFVQHRVEVVKNRTVYDLEKAKDRVHILEGLAVAIDNIEEIVQLIKGSSDTKGARARLSSEYKLSERQSDAILEMQLRRLTSLEEGTIKNEISLLKKEIGKDELVLSDDKYVYEIIKEETVYVKGAYGRERRTRIDSDLEDMSIDNEDLIKDEESVIIRTKNNYVKRLPASAYKEQGRGGRGVMSMELKEGDYVVGIISCMSKDYLLVVTDKRKVYWLKAYGVPASSRYGSGKAIINLINIEQGENIINMISTRDFADKFLIFTTKTGRIKKVRGEAFSRPRSNGIKVLPEMDNDKLAGICISAPGSELFIATRNGKGLRFPSENLRSMGKMALGVRGIRLGKDDEVVGIISVASDSLVLTVTKNGYGKCTGISDYRLQKRGGKGVLNIKINQKIGDVVKVIACKASDRLLIVNSNGVSIEISVSSIRKTGRNASGVRLVSLEQKVAVVDAKIL